MTDKEEPQPRAPRRHNYSNRGRSGYNRIYQHLGVRDLREIIDRKRSERVETGTPPSDPSCNYLKDPLRDNVEHNDEVARPPRKPKNNVYKRDYQKPPVNHPKPKDIENPLNIKVEFSTSTGEHSYKFDESTVLPTIKHVPDHRPMQNRSFRGRGRGRGRGPRSYFTRTIRNKQTGEFVNTELTTQDGAPENDVDLNDTKEEIGEEHNENKDLSLEVTIENLKLDDDETEK